MKNWLAAEGSTVPLGVSWVADEQAYNIALYSQHATAVTVLFFSSKDLQTPCHEVVLDPLVHKTASMWHCRVPRAALNGARFYAFSIDGPREVGWHAFDPEKLILDPLARALYFPPTFERQAAMQPGSNVGRAPLSVLTSHEPPFDWEDDRPIRHESDLVIYEMHVRGFSRHASSGVPVPKAGTFAGVIEKIPYLRRLGVTAIELMPVFQFDPADGDYWGYMPLSFFAPHHLYTTDPARCGQHTEFRSMVKALHKAGMEVILDVVFNHTAEGDHRGPTYSFKGIDCSNYYLMSGDAANPFQNYSGCGNTLQTSNRIVRRLILESLRYWVKEMHVDGFRFDLASVLARRADGTIGGEDPPIFGDIAADPDLAHIRLIAEPWDAGGAYQLGRGFPGIRWFQWNGRFRDEVRRFVKGDAGMVPAIMRRLYGSDDLFPDEGEFVYHPYQSVNYLTSHDGFTLYDLQSYEEKRNWANGHGNTDGPSQEYGWNCGWEGDDGVPREVVALRKRQIRNLACLLFLANGTPMLRAGDEFLQTQHGNNNPYNQDNETSWLDWGRLDSHPEMFRFFARLIAFRKAHPSICRSRYWRDDVRWFGVQGNTDLSAESRALAYFLHGASQGDGDLYVMINAWWQPLDFAIQVGQSGQWKRVIDTSLEGDAAITDPDAELPVTTSAYRVEGRSVVVLLRKTGA